MRAVAKALLALWLCLLPLAAGAADRGGRSLRETVGAHFAAISARDLHAPLATVTTHDALTLIFPDGSKLDTRAQYVDFHAKWFREHGRTFRGEVLDVIETKDLGHVFARYRYEDAGADGKRVVKTNRLALTFTREHGAWRLVFDRNTRAAAPAA